MARRLLDNDYDYIDEHEDERFGDHSYGNAHRPPKVRPNLKTPAARNDCDERELGWDEEYSQ